MNKIWQYIIWGLITSFITTLLVYAKLWEGKQFKQHMPQVKVLSIEPYSYVNDLHWSSRGYRVYVANEHRPIDFSIKNWDSTLQEGDIVDVVAKRSFPWFGLKDELDGINVYNVK